MACRDPMLHGSYGLPKTENRSICLLSLLSRRVESRSIDLTAPRLAIEPRSPCLARAHHRIESRSTSCALSDSLIESRSRSCDRAKPVILSRSPVLHVEIGRSWLKGQLPYEPPRRANGTRGARPRARCRPRFSSLPGHRGERCRAHSDRRRSPENRQPEREGSRSRD